MAGGSNSATKPLPRLEACTATRGKARLPVRGAIDTVTVAWAALMSDVPSAGSSNATWKVVSAPRPVTSSAAVVTWSIALSAALSPRTVTTVGSLVTRVIQ